MQINDKIRFMREMSNWTQEEFAERLDMSPNSYAKFERSESKATLEKLEKIAKAFNVELTDLLSSDKQALIWLMGDGNTHNSANYYNNDNQVMAELVKLQEILSLKDELLAQKDLLIKGQAEQIATLKELLDIQKSKE